MIARAAWLASTAVMVAWVVWVERSSESVCVEYTRAPGECYSRNTSIVWTWPIILAIIAIVIAVGAILLRNRSAGRALAATASALALGAAIGAAAGA